MSKFINKFFSWTLIYKTFAFLEAIIHYLKTYYYISDTFYSEEFKTVIKRYLCVDLKRDWIGRLYGIINPNINSNGEYDFSNTIFEIDGANTNNDEYIKNIIYGKMDLINRQFHIDQLYDYIHVDFKHVGPIEADNYLVVFDIMARKYLTTTFKRFITHGLFYAIVATTVLILI